MIGREVGKHRDIRGQGAGKVGLIGGQLQHHHAAIARRAHLPLGTVRSRIHRARKTLRGVLERTGGAPFAARGENA